MVIIGILVIAVAIVVALAVVFAIVAGLITVTPFVLLIMILPLIDYFVIKLIFGKKKKD